MFAIEVGDIRELIEAAVTAVSVLGGAMAYCSGLAAARAMAGDPQPDLLSQRINEGLAEGFEWGLPLAASTLMLLVWS